MTFKQIAENLRTTGKKFKWGRMMLVSWQSAEPAYCALGIKATEFGVPTVVLAYAQSDDRKAAYERFSLGTVFGANDRADDYQGVLDALEARQVELEAGDLLEPDIEGWVEYLKTLEPAAREWAQENGYKSLLT